MDGGADLHATPSRPPVVLPRSLPVLTCCLSDSRVCRSAARTEGGAGGEDEPVMMAGRTLEVEALRREECGS